MTPLIHLDGIVKGYRNGDVITPVLHGITLGVARGEYVALMGPSAARASRTLLNVLGLLDARRWWSNTELDGQDATSTLNDACGAGPGAQPLDRLRVPVLPPASSA
jgi:ABC-type lipoprotein export system ATPase subunit